MVGFSGLGGLGAVPGGYMEAEEQAATTEAKRVATQKARQGIQAGNIDLASQAAFGNAVPDFARALQMMSNPSGVQQPGPPGIPPGQPSQPTAPPPQLRGGGPQGMPPAAMFGPQGMPGVQLGGDAGASPQPGSPAMRPAPAMGGMPPPQQPQQPQQAQPPSPGGPQQQGPAINLQSIIATVVKNNPGAPPAVLAGAIDHAVKSFGPLIRSEEVAYWRERSLQIKEEGQKGALEEKARSREQKERLFKEKEARLADQFDAKQEAVWERIRQTDDKNEIAKYRAELLKIQEEHKNKLGELREQRLQEQGEERIAVKREEIGSRERITDVKTKSAEKIAEQKADTAERGQDVRATTAIVTAGMKAETAKELEASREAAAMERAKLNDKTKRDLGEMNAELRKELQKNAIGAKFDLTTMTTQAQAYVKGLDREQRAQLARALEASRREEKALDRASREKQQQDKLAVTREVLSQRNDMQLQRLGLSKEKFYGPSADMQKRILDNDGITTERIAAAGDRIALTGEKQPHDMAGLSPAAKQAYQTAVSNYVNEKYKQENKDPGTELAAAPARYKTAQVTMNKFMGAGPQGDSVRFLSVAESHINTLRTLAHMWQESGGILAPGNIAKLNEIKAYIAKNIAGYAEPKDMEAAAKILGTEIIKSLAVARAGTAQEREEIQGMLTTTLSPTQMFGAPNKPGMLDTFERLLGGQLTGLRNQFVAGAGYMLGKNGAERAFNAMLTEEAQARINDIKNDPKWTTASELAKFKAQEHQQFKEHTVDWRQYGWSPVTGWSETRPKPQKKTAPSTWDLLKIVPMKKPGGYGFQE